MFFDKYYSILESSFDEWYERACSSNANDTLESTFDYDYFMNQFENDWVEYSQSNDYEIDDKAKKDDYYELMLKEKAKDFFNSHIDEVFEDIQNNLEKIDENHIKVYRKINIQKNDYDKFIKAIENNTFLYNKTGIGRYWSYSKNATQCHWGEFNSGMEILLVGIIPLSAINMNQTIHANLDISLGLDEKEINLVENGENHINIITINDYDCDLLVVI